MKTCFNAQELKAACDLVERHCRAIGPDCEIIFLEYGVQIAPLEWSGASVESTLYDGIMTFRKERGLDKPAPNPVKCELTGPQGQNRPQGQKVANMTANEIAQFVVRDLNHRLGAEDPARFAVVGTSAVVQDSKSTTSLHFTATGVGFGVNGVPKRGRPFVLGDLATVAPRLGQKLLAYTTDAAFEALVTQAKAYDRAQKRAARSLKHATAMAANAAPAWGAIPSAWVDTGVNTGTVGATTDTVAGPGASSEAVVPNPDQPVTTAV